MILHRRQFVLGPRPVRVAEDWRTLDLSPGLCLSHCPTLPVSTATDVDGVYWCLLGVAIQTDPAGAAPTVELSTARTQEVPTLYRDWAGRWLLVADQRIHLDACGTLGCFYRVEGTTAWASSSGALLARIPNGKPLERAAPVVPHHGAGLPWYRTGMNWVPPPRSRFEGVARLLPSQILDLSQDIPRVTPRALVSELADGWSYEQKLDFLQDRLETAFRNLELPEQLWIPLTGGVDSRLVVSLAKHLELQPDVYTFAKPFGRFAKGDAALPPLLAERVGFKHHLIRGGRSLRSRAALFDEHTGQQCMDADRHYVVHGQWDQVPRHATITPGNIFVLGHLRWAELNLNKLSKTERFSRESRPPSSAEDIASRIIDGFAFERHHAKSAQHYLGISDWAEWVWSHPEENLDWRDRWTIEQRIAGDVSSTEQGLDLIGPTRLHLVNSTMMVSTILSFPGEVKAVAQHHKDLIGRLAPGLLEYPFNPPDSRMNVAAIKLRRRFDQGGRAPRKIRRLLARSRQGGGVSPSSPAAAGGRPRKGNPDPR